MRRAFVAASRAAFKAIYRVSRRQDRENLAVFLSRQTDEPSYDFAELAGELERRGWTCVMHLKKVRARNIVPYVGHVVREIRLLGKCKLAVLDRYDPVVSLLDFECGDARGNVREARKARGDAPGCKNLDFPQKPVVLQVWHAFGAFKKFGFQSVGTLEGHSAAFTDAYNIHRNYSWVLCSGSGARDAFAEAFSCPRERVVPLVRPEYDELVAARVERDARKAGAPGRFRVLMAPTLRKSGESAHPFKELFERRQNFERGIDADVCWSFHPLEQGLPAPGNVSENLLSADLVVTDYSSIAYEAYVLGVPVVFYVPDLDSYRDSPGLNADPETLCPKICARNERQLIELVQRFANDPDDYPLAAFEAFAASGFDDGLDELPGTATSRIVDFALAQV